MLIIKIKEAIKNILNLKAKRFKVRKHAHLKSFQKSFKFYKIVLMVIILVDINLLSQSLITIKN